MGIKTTPKQRRVAAAKLRSLGNTAVPALAISPVDYLADLVDWPTCTMDATDSRWTTDGEMVVVWECSNCGQECEELNGSYEFCPHCGAEVV